MAFGTSGIERHFFAVMGATEEALKHQTNGGAA
jgi:hypothetical protein